MEAAQSQHLALLQLSHRPSSSQALYSTPWQARYNSSRTLRYFLCGATGRCFCVCVSGMFPAVLRNRNATKSRERGNYILLIDAVQAGRTTLPICFLGISQSRAQSRSTAQQQQQYSSSTTAPTLEALVFVTDTALLCVQCSPADHAVVTTFSRVILKSVTPSNLIVSSCQ